MNSFPSTAGLFSHSGDRPTVGGATVIFSVQSLIVGNRLDESAPDKPRQGQGERFSL